MSGILLTFLGQGGGSLSLVDYLVVAGGGSGGGMGGGGAGGYQSQSSTLIPRQ